MVSISNSAYGGGYQSQQASGYLSGGIGTDTESARLSNIQPYKYNGNSGVASIQKVHPNAPVSRGQAGRRNIQKVIDRESSSEVGGGYSSSLGKVLPQI